MYTSVFASKNSNQVITLKVHVTDEPQFPRFRVDDAVDAHVNDRGAFFHHVCCDQTGNT